MIINPLCGDHSKGALIICLHPIDYGDEEYVAILCSVSVMCYVVVCTVLTGEKSVRTALRFRFIHLQGSVEIILLFFSKVEGLRVLRKV